MTDSLTVADVLTLYEDPIHRRDGAHGVRDLGLLASALSRPQTGYYDTLIQEAAALWESLAQNHPFIDGNKRTAFASTYTFLKINDIRITADSSTAWEFIRDSCEPGRLQCDVLASWLQNHVTFLEDS